jgi:porin
MGFAISHAGINNNVGNETTFEITYKAIFGDHFFIQPDFQYIINPAGTDKILKDCFIGFVRFGIQF